MDYPERKARFNARFAEDYLVVLRFVERRVNDDHSAQDITAEAFLLLWKKDIGETPLGRGWLCKTASHLVGNYYRRARRRRVAEQSTMILAVAESRELPPADVLILREAIASLSPKMRDIVSLHYWDGLSAPEIADFYGTSASAVWTALSRARGVLRERLAADDAAERGNDA